MEFRCTHCGSLNIETEQKGSQLGLYCADCGKWIKWLNKDERNYFKKQNNSTDLIDKIRDLIKNINNEVEKELEKEPLSNEDSIRKCAYTYGLDKVRYSLEDIIEESGFNED